MIDARKRTVEGVTVLDLTGTLDLDGINLLKEKIQEIRQGGATKIVLNFDRVNSVQSTVIPQLLTPIRALTLLKGRVAFAGMNDPVHKTVKTAMFYSIIIVSEDVESAVEELKSEM
ncbi:MAG: STAS domain-containing protein [bacterium]|nr:STAS domain-containing protein [bacterium]